MELEDVLLVESVGRLGAPEQSQVAGQHLLGQVAIDELVDSSGVAHVGIAYDAEGLARDGLKHGEQRVVAAQLGVGLVLGGVGGSVATVAELQLGGSLLGRGLRAVSGSRVLLLRAVVAIGQTLVQLDEIRRDLLVVVGLPELQVGATLQQLAHTLRLADTRHFDHQSAFLSLELLDVGLHDAKLVDTVADHVVGVVDGGGHFCAQGALHLLIRTLRAHLALELLGGEDLGQAVARCVLVVSVDEERDEVALARLLLLLGLLERLHIGRVGLVVSEHIDDVGYGDLQNDVHTALQVKAEADLCLQTLLIRVDAQILHGVLVVLPRNGIFDLLGLAVIVAGGYRERQVEDTCERQQDGHANY